MSDESAEKPHEATQRKLDEARKREDLAVIYLHMAHGYKALDQKENARRMAMEAVQRASSDSLSDQEIRASAQGLLNELR